MLITIGFDDKAVEKIADASLAKNPDVFGTSHNLFTRQLPTLQPDENLFVVARDFSVIDDGRPVIGSIRNTVILTAQELFMNLQIFPSDYAGKIFIYAASSISGARFIEEMNRVVRRYYHRVNVYRYAEEPGDSIPLPCDRYWQKA